jgi:predicted AlkP superfamily phosphohydrolase/phosphomutase
VLTAAAALLAAAPWIAACGSGGDGSGDREVPGFPPEPGPGQFPGITYPPASGPLPKPASLKGPVWLVGVDGATLRMILPMAARGELPAFEGLMDSGSWGLLRSEEPMISPALWATIATGTPRFTHGISNFRVRVPATYTLVQAGPPDRRAPALWEFVGAAGGTSAVVNWFGSFPAESIAGAYVSRGFDPESPRPHQVHPPDLAERLASGAKVVMRKRDLEEIGWNEDYRKALVDDARAMAALQVVLQQDHPDFVAVYFSGIDIVQHAAWGHMDPASRAFPEDGEADPDLGRIIPAYYRYIDHMLGRIREMAPRGTTLVVVSDHGAGPMRRDEAFVPSLPGLLEAMGLMRGEQGTLFTLSQPYRHEKPVWINIKDVESSGSVEPEQAAAIAASVRDRLLALRTESGEPIFTSVADLTTGPEWAPGDPALSVRFSYAARSARTVDDGGRSIPASAFVSRLPAITGSHRPEGILMLQGPGIRAGRLSDEAGIYQIAPTVLYLLGLPQDGRMLSVAPAGGGVLEAALEPSLLRKHPITMIPAYPGTDRGSLLRESVAPDDPGEMDPAHDREIEKLRSLGYIR